MTDKKSNPAQIAQSVYDIQSESISIHDVTNLVPDQYNEILFTYSGTNSEPLTATYLYNSVIIAVITFTYDVRGRVTRVYRST